jgi:hypothetical protein
VVALSERHTWLVACPREQSRRSVAGDRDHGRAGVADGGSGDGSADASPHVTTGDAASVPADAGLLPSSLKGYELYAWEEGGLLWFTLITGTNRLKTLDEISRKNVYQRDDFVHINSSGWDNLQAVLALVPRGTPVVLDEKIPGLPPLGEQSRDRILQMLRALGP